MQPPTNINTIVVLGGGVRNNTHAPPNTQLGSASLSRLIEGIRLYKLIRNQSGHAKLILSGGRVFGVNVEAHKMQNTAVILGVRPSDMVLARGSKDTYDEALYLKNKVGNKRFIVVTSAVHMPRTMALFHKQGMRPIAAPTQYIADKKKFNCTRLIPSTSNLIHTDIALHEYFGMWWAKLRGFA